MTQPDIKALRRIAGEATAGPWVTAPRFGVYALVQTPGEYPLAITDILPRAAGVQAEQEANAAHITAFNPLAVLALLDRIDALEEALGRLRRNLDIVGLCPKCAGAHGKHSGCDGPPRAEPTPWGMQG